MRNETLGPDSPVESLFRINPFQKEALNKLGIKTLGDILFYFPSRYGEKAEIKHIADLKDGDNATISGKVLKTRIFKTFKTKVPASEMTIEDDTGRLKAIWFHQAYMAKKVAEGGFVRMTGLASFRKTAKFMINPDIEETQGIILAHHDSLFSKEDLASAPVYPETRAISTLWMRHAVKRVINAKIHEKIADPIPKEILNKYHLPSLRTALIWIHSPKKEDDARSARKRFSFEEVLMIQIARLKEKKEYEKNPSFNITTSDGEIEKFSKKFNFEMTGAQKRAISEIINDFRISKPMARLLEGDVGSGKTAVAVAATYAIINTSPYGNPPAGGFGNLQTAYMAPTEILAGQHFESFIKYLKGSGINIGLITGSGCKKFPSKSDPNKPTDISRTQLLKWVENGEIPVLIGTHALIQKSVKFKHLGLVIIDEQHRFGVGQRLKLAKKTSDAPDGKNPPADGAVPHLLSMTATPIPRTLALTIYGDLDLTLLDEMPAGRKTVITEIITPPQREKIYEKMREELKNGRQAYIICPRIDEPDPEKEMALNAKSVKAEAKRLKRSVFLEYEFGILHSKMSPKEKESVMKEFSDGKINILAATSVVEVGVNVPNATVIIIEGGERFGLAQLHQLRGRVLRSNHQAYCYIVSESRTPKTMERLKAIKTAKNGFELAELDLKLRGAGELGGGKQWGISDIGMEAIKNIKMVEAARNEAKNILETDPEMKNYPLLRKKVGGVKVEMHFE